MSAPKKRTVYVVVRGTEYPENLAVFSTRKKAEAFVADEDNRVQHAYEQTCSIEVFEVDERGKEDA